jgi:hypothetical protein
MRENDKALRKVGRDLDREKNKLEMEEKKLVSMGCLVLGI